VTPLRQRMLDELQRRNYNADTIRGYIHAVKEFAEYFGKSPEGMGADEVREFQLYMIREKKLALGTVALRMGALRFLYKKTLRRRDIDIEDLPLVRAPKKLPVVLSQEEVVRLIEGALNLRHRTILMLLYGTGLRRAEAVRLKISDIDTALMLIHVHQGKGSRDRDLPLTAKLLEALREYWRWCKNKPHTYLFPSRVEPVQPERPLSDKVVWNACHEAALRAGLTKRIGPHTLRTVSRHTCWKPERTCARSSYCWDISASKIPRFIYMSPADICRRPSIRWIRSQSATFLKTTGFLTTSNGTPTLGGGRCHSAGRQSIPGSLSKVLDLPTGEGAKRHCALPYGRVGWTSRSVRPLRSSDHLV
jgi:integrase/recombinase XerD